VANVRRLRRAFKTAACPYYSSDSAITGLRIGTEEYTRAVSDALFEAGNHAPAMTYPVMAHGGARLRFQVSAAHTEGDLDQVAQTICRCIGQTSS
jgi:7-keto-8-aminopelargonate synthetase-like enzyme